MRYKLLASTNPQHAAAPRPAPPGPAPPGPRVETRVTTNTANTAAAATTAAGPPLPRGLAANLTRLAAAGAGHNNNNNNNGNSGQQPPAPGQWAPTLEADRAGMASNAEDFTREFMKQLTGGQ